MKRLRDIVMATGLVALAFAPRVAGAKTEQREAGDFGGNQYGAPIEEQEPLAPEEQEPLAPEEEMEPGAEPMIEQEIEQEYPAREPSRVEPRQDVDVHVHPETGEIQPGMEPQVEPMPERERRRTGLGALGLGFSVGGGVTDFVDDDVEGLTDVGGTWDARLTFGTRYWIGLEAAYVGTAQDIEALGLDPDAVLLSNGVEGLVRVNLGTFDIQPFVFGGAGWQHYNIVNEDFNTSSVNDDDDVLTVPFGAGLAGYIPGTGLMLDARFTYRPAFEEDLLQPGTGNETNEDLDSWLVTGRLGFTF